MKRFVPCLLYRFFMVGAACLPMAAWASPEPIKLSSDSRIEVVAYSPYNVVPVQGNTFTTTQILFDESEYIENIQNGDLGAWTASISKTIPYMLFVKPTAYDSNTNMTVVTNKRTYYFHLSSNAKEDTHPSDVTYAIHFLYPEEQKEKVEQAIVMREKQKQAELSAFQNPEDYNWDYSFSGNQRITPLHVFDDGKFTYLQLQPDQPVPAVFVVDNPDGKESLVNYRQDGRYLVITRVAPQFTLRVGDDAVVSLFNNQRIKQLQKNHWSS